MTFDTAERSIAGGRPIRLYEFQRGFRSFRYTNADREISFGGEPYAPESISDDGIRQSGEASAEALTLVVRWNLPVAQLFRAAPPASEVFLTVRNLHEGEPDGLVSWVGSIQGVRWPSPERAHVICQTLGATFERPGLRLAYERGCPHSLYDRNCRIDPLGFQTVATLSAVTGATIQSPTFDVPADGWFDGGYVEWEADGDLDRRGVITHVGSTLTMLGGTSGMTAGLLVRAYPGCLRTIQVCNDKFNNVPNYGGFPHLPGKSPFDGTPVF